MLARFEAGDNQPTPIHLPQAFLSVSIDELTEQIRERYQVTIRQLD